MSLNKLDFDRYDSNLLAERAVLTRAVCRELREGHDPYYGRPYAAVRVVQRWLKDNYDYSMPTYNPSEIAEAPADCKNLMEEIQDGQRICNALSVYGTADSAEEHARDGSHLREALEEYWLKHPNAVQSP